jgi:uncharacterized repeat protein (TIGR04076 family)
MSPVGFRIVGTIKEIKGKCNAGHKVGDTFELDGLDSGRLCGFFYHDIFPYLITLQFGGSFPWNENPDIAEYECPDRTNAVKIELKRIRK